MASQGNLELKSSSLVEIYDAVFNYQKEIQDALYAQYKIAYKISFTNYMKGNTADAFKEYFSKGTVNMIQGILELSSEMTAIIQLIVEVFYKFEGASDGIIKEAQLDSIGTDLNQKRQKYNQMGNELGQVINLASKYISTTDLKYIEIDERYVDVEKSISKMRQDIYEIEEDSVKNAEQLLERINSLKNLITETMGLCYKDGNFIPESSGLLDQQSWYSKQGNATLALLLSEDPFEYDAGSVSISEDQWAAGLCSDVYAYAGYSWMSAEYECGREDSSIFVKAKGSVLETNGYAQLTNEIKAQADADVGYASSDIKVGWGDGYYGGHVKVEVGGVRVNGSVIVGTENYNVYVRGDAKVACADGKAAFEFKEDGQFAIGVDGSATLASASVETGFSSWGYKAYGENATKEEKKDLFKLSAGVSASAGGGVAAYAESKKVIETDYVNVNAVSIKLKGEFIAGACVQITVPVPYVKWPW